LNKLKNLKATNRFKRAKNKEGKDRMKLSLILILTPNPKLIKTESPVAATKPKIGSK
jgi:hypothetical protein